MTTPIMLYYEAAMLQEAFAQALLDADARQDGEYIRRLHPIYLKVAARVKRRRLEVMKYHKHMFTPHLSTLEITDPKEL